ncbi:RNA polymerase sigma-70 factor [Jatrophihabitans sp. DSM 45814]
MESSEVATYQKLRPLMFSIAYRMLSGVSEAEDIVQEAFLRYDGALAEGVEIESPKAFLAAVTTRLSIDHLRSAHVRRERYIGTWLPEPLLTATGRPLLTAGPEADDPAEYTEMADSLSMAFLVLLERLTPLERAVFLLHDIFGYEYGEVAGIVERSEDYCRQLASRARRHVTDQKPRFESSREQQNRLRDAFIRAVSGVDVNGLVTVLASDVVVYGDGGGTRPSWPKPIFGRDRVNRLLLALGQEIRQLQLRVEAAEVNGQPGAIVRDCDGQLINVWALDIVDGTIAAIRSVINPGKLGHLGPLANRQRLMGQLTRGEKG